MDLSWTGDFGFWDGVMVKKDYFLARLFDTYQSLLTSKQQKYFFDYYFENFSLQEISDDYGVSRSAVHRQLKEIEKKLNEYEKKLNFIAKKDKIESIIKDEKFKKRVVSVLEEE